ncbi:MAG: hypothetical protein ABIJ97_16840 [Bacteroidota bacterium]
MRRVIQLLSIIIVISLLHSCGGGTGGYYVKYTDKDGNKVNLSAGDVSYTFTNGVYLNTFAGKPTMVAQFKLEDAYNFEVEGMVGKVIDVMVFESEKSIIWNAEDFVPEKSFKCTVEAFTFVKKGMMDDNIYKVTGKFSVDGFKDGELALQVNI